MPILKAITPWGAESDAIDSYRSAVSTLGQETVVQLPQSNDDAFGKYDLDILEASDQAWLSFLGLITQCNAEITLALLGQNLTTEVKEGSFAAARVHADVRQAILESDARSLEHTIYTQIARPFAAINFGNPSLAPRTRWQVSPVEDKVACSQVISALGDAVSKFRTGGVSITNLEEIARNLGIRIEFKEEQPVQVESRAVASGTEETNEDKEV
jgi:phage gp29-like protein